MKKRIVTDSKRQRIILTTAKNHRAKKTASICFLFWQNMIASKRDYISHHINATGIDEIVRITAAL